MREEQNGVQQQINNTLAEAREIRRQMKLQQPRLQCLRREHELLSEALQRPQGGGGSNGGGIGGNGGGGVGGASSSSLPPPPHLSAASNGAFRSLVGGRATHPLAAGGYTDPLDGLGLGAAAAALTSEQSAILMSELAALRESAARDELAALRESAAASGLLAAGAGAGLSGGLGGLSSSHHLSAAAAAQGLLGQPPPIGDLRFNGPSAHATAAWLTANAGAAGAAAAADPPGGGNGEAEGGPS